MKLIKLQRKTSCRYCKYNKARHTNTLYGYSYMWSNKLWNWMCEPQMSPKIPVHKPRRQLMRWQMNWTAVV